MKLSAPLIRLLFTATIMIWLLGGMVDVMDVDAAQYASISMEMAQKNSWLEVYEDDSPYLDKPPLIFWTAAIAFKLFGVSALAYKLPSILFALLAVLSVYGFSKTHYNERTATLAALMLATCQAIFLITNDVRTDTLLTGSVSLAIWQLSNYLIRPKWKFLFWGSVGIGLGMLAKGPLGLVIPAMALGTHALLRKRWDHIFKWQWSITILIVGLMLLPMCVGLYRQFGTEGLKFYFWTQSFGRITGESKWSDDSTYFFFTHTYVWAFLPWALISLPALWNRIKEAPRTIGKTNGEELISLGGVLLPFIALSMSRYKLPHYIFVIFPMASVITAAYLARVFDGNNAKSKKAISGIQVAITVVLLLVTIAGFLPFGMPNAFVLFGLITIIVMMALIVRSSWGQSSTRVVVLPILGMLFANLMAAGHFYPHLLEYQSMGQAGKIIHERGFDRTNAWYWENHGHSLCFEARTVLKSIYDVERAAEICENGPMLLYTDPEKKELLDQTDLNVEVVREFEHFNVTQLSLQFLDPSTRAEELRTRYLLEISKP